MLNKKPIEQRFWEKVGEHSDPHTCWLWLGGKGGIYGHFKNGQRTVCAHRFAYELLVGSIPEGFTIDHVKARGCINSLCVNPLHLEAVSRGVNVLRGIGPPALNARKVVCSNGHPFDEKNTYVWHGRRGCRICQKLRMEQWRYRHVETYTK